MMSGWECVAVGCAAGCVLFSVCLHYRRTHPLFFAEPLARGTKSRRKGWGVGVGILRSADYRPLITSVVKDNGPDPVHFLIAVDDWFQHFTDVGYFVSKLYSSHSSCNTCYMVLLSYGNNNTFFVGWGGGVSGSGRLAERSGEGLFEHRGRYSLKEAGRCLMVTPAEKDDHTTTTPTTTATTTTTPTAYFVPIFIRLGGLESRTRRSGCFPLSTQWDVKLAAIRTHADSTSQGQIESSGGRFRVASAVREYGTTVPREISTMSL